MGNHSCFRGLAAALFLMVAGCQGPEAAFTGTWRGRFECDGQFRGSGDRYTEGPADQELLVDSAADGRAFIAGRGCTIWLEPLSDQQANASTDAPCMVTSSGGEPVRVEVPSGIVQRRGDALSYTLAWVFTVDPGGPTEDIADVTCTFEGRRE